jgi:hypothetical protein
LSELHGDLQLLQFDMARRGRISRIIPLPEAVVARQHWPKLLSIDSMIPVGLERYALFEVTAGEGVVSASDTFPDVDEPLGVKGAIRVFHMLFGIEFGPFPFRIHPA